MKPTAEQLAVIESSGDVYVRACPGAGKTRTLVDLAARATEGTPRAGVAFLSFTNAAGTEVRERLAAKVPRLLHAPNFVGTFDSFLIRHVLGPDGLERAPGLRIQFRESWGERVGDMRKGGISLDVFVPDGNTVRIEDARAGSDYAMRAELKKLNAAARAKLCAVAKERIASRMKLGIVTATFLRTDAARRLAKPNAATYAAARFRLVLVDEAQDCDPIDLQIVSSLRSAGSRCVIVADPEQGIFRWRGADPSGLEKLGLTALPLTGNFRSRASICAASASLRAEGTAPDTPLGAHAADSAVVLLPYQPPLGVDVGRTFERVIGARGIELAQAMVVAHQEDVARNAVGIEKLKTSAATGAVLARGVASTASAADRAAAVEIVQNVLARALEVGLDDRPRQRWCEFTARQVVGVAAAAPPVRGLCSRLKDALGALRPPHGTTFVVPPKKLLTAREPKSENAPAAGAAALPVRFSTVHGVKGREFDAVLVVLPEGRISELIAAWRSRDAAHDGRAVVYVAATRARHVLAFAVPHPAADEAAELLRRQGAAVEVISCVALAGAAALPGA